MRGLHRLRVRLKRTTRMSGDKELDDMLGPDLVAEPEENLVETAVKTPTPSQGVLARSRSFPTTYAPKKNKPELMKRALAYAAEMPVTADVARRLGRSITTIRYWLQKSLEGV